MSDETNPVAPRNANVFLMIRFREGRQYEHISETLMAALQQYGLRLIRADIEKLRDELWANVRECMDSSGYGIAVFEQMTEPHLSPNVSLELGYMLAQNKRCLLLIASCINNAIMRAEDFNPYAQTEGERRSP